MNGSDQGYVQKRRGVVDHLQQGRMTLLEYGAFDFVVLSADKATGVWLGNAQTLSLSCGAGDVSVRQARTLLESLERKRYIRRFSVLGSRSVYPIAVHQYKVTFGARSGTMLDAWNSTSYEELRYEWPPGASELPASCPPGGRQVAIFLSRALTGSKANSKARDKRLETNSNTTTRTQNSRPAYPPCGKVEKSKATPQQRVYAQTGELIRSGEELLQRGEVNSIPDLKEELKLLAAKKDMTNYGAQCNNTADIALRRHEGRAKFTR